MTRRTTSIVAAVLAAGVVTGAQAPAAGVTQSLQQSWDAAKKHVTESAEAVPEAHYGFKPADSVRTFGQILAHIAGANHNFCAAAKGETTKISEDEFEKSTTSRAGIIKALGASMAYCDSVFKGLTDARLSEAIEMPFGMGKGTRASAILGNIGHLNEHYGNLVTYMRIKGIVPPSSR